MELRQVVSQRSIVPAEVSISFWVLGKDITINTTVLSVEFPLEQRLTQQGVKYGSGQPVSIETGVVIPPTVSMNVNAKGDLGLVHALRIEGSGHPVVVTRLGRSLADLGCPVVARAGLTISGRHSVN